jgi:hypothetical protein
MQRIVLALVADDDPVTVFVESQESGICIRKNDTELVEAVSIGRHTPFPPLKQGRDDGARKLSVAC